MSIPASPRATAIRLRRLREEGTLTRAEAAALETLLRESLPWPLWIGRVLLAIGAGLLLSGVVFFFAYNWRDLAPAAKFALLEGGLLLCALAAWRVGIDALGGKLALLGGCVFTGVFLAVHGQIYQTGADNWMLFAAWAALILPWAMLARFPALWVFWLGLVNAAVGLAASERLWTFLSVFDFDGTLALLAAINALALTAWEIASLRRWLWMDEGWVRAVVILAAFGYLTAAVSDEILAQGNHATSIGWVGWIALAPLGYWFYRHVRPLLPCLTVIAFSACTVLITLVSRGMYQAVGDPVGTALLMGVIVVGIFGAALWWLRVEARALNHRKEAPHP